MYLKPVSTLQQQNRQARHSHIKHVVDLAELHLFYFSTTFKPKDI
jgi:hypothetical protein